MKKLNTQKMQTVEGGCLNATMIRLVAKVCIYIKNILEREFKLF